MWDERYAGDNYYYGTEPNDFLVASAERIPAGVPVLCLAEGEGRNAVFLARRGHPVTAVDLSREGLRKAARLARRHEVEIECIQADLAAFDPGQERWGGIVSIFAHLPPAQRRTLHARLPQALQPGGVLILEAYTPEQLSHGTGGPPSRELMMEAAVLRDELPGLELLHLEELEREVIEGAGHHGLAAVVQLIARRPDEPVNGDAPRRA